MTGVNRQIDKSLSISTNNLWFIRCITNVAKLSVRSDTINRTLRICEDRKRRSGKSVANMIMRPIFILLTQLSSLLNKVNVSKNIGHNLH
jgi:hypothetical protein